jgi:hypothetical protein
MKMSNIPTLFHYDLLNHDDACSPRRRFVKVLFRQELLGYQSDQFGRCERRLPGIALKRLCLRTFDVLDGGEEPDCG